VGCSLYEDLYVFGGGVDDAERLEEGEWRAYRGFPQLNEFDSIAASGFKR